VYASKRIPANLYTMKRFLVLTRFIALMQCMYSANAFKSLTPKLELKTHVRPAFRYQKDEFSMEWEKVWASYYDSKEEFHSFMTYLFDNACKPPKRIAIEQFPYEMLVCVHKCQDGYVAVLEQTKKGERKRTCKREPTH